MQTVKLFTNLGELTIDDVDEYVCGRQYFFIRHVDGTTTSINRKTIHEGFRQLSDGNFYPISMKKPQTRNGGFVHDTSGRDHHVGSQVRRQTDGEPSEVTRKPISQTG